MRALAAFERACGAGDARACSFVSLLYLDGPDSFARDLDKSLEAMKRACQLGLARACEWMKSQSED
jgi:TPR repeat protein